MKNIWPEIKQLDRRLSVTHHEKSVASAARINASFADLKSAPSLDSGLDTQLLFGDRVSVLERKNEWAKVHASFDLSGNVDAPGYVGWVLTSALSTAASMPTHRVFAPRSFLYPGPQTPYCFIVSTLPYRCLLPHHPKTNHHKAIIETPVFQV